MAALSERTALACRYEQTDLLTVRPEEPFEAVTAISMMEDIPPDVQEAHWRRLAALVPPAGLLVVTVDYGATPEGWGSDEERKTRFHANYVRDNILPWLHAEGVQTGEVALDYGEDIGGGPNRDYSFFRLIGRRT